MLLYVLHTPKKDGNAHTYVCLERRMTTTTTTNDQMYDEMENVEGKKKKHE